MDATLIIAFVLLAGVMIKELSYFSPHMLFTHKSVIEYCVFGCGLAVLLFLIIRFASGFWQISFGIIGIIAFAAMWLKQGISTKGVLTIAHFGQEFFPWKSVSFVKITGEKVLTVLWYKEDGSLLLKQKYSRSQLAELQDRIAQHESLSMIT